KWNPVLNKIKRNANFTVNDWVREQNEYWKPRIFENKEVHYYSLFENQPHFRYDNIYPTDDLLTGYKKPEELKKILAVRRETISRLLGVDISKIRSITHEDCHTYYSYFASPMRGDVLAITSEGIGDYSSGTVSVMNDKGRNEIAHTYENHIGHIYQYMTLLLGMKPAQHEYKVMGMAPYANIKELEKSYEIFKDILKVEGLNIVFNKKPKDLYFHFVEALQGHRFDGIAGAVQKFTEELLCEWVTRCVEETGIKRVCFSGGVAQNIKAGMRLMQLPDVEDIFICPAAGDTSISIGACYFAMWEFCTENKTSTECIQPIDNIYLGPTFNNDDVQSYLNSGEMPGEYTIQANCSAQAIAEMLADGKILGRCTGPMEFGLRSLGNRSILADPRNPDTLRKINTAIKFRDFWMPFTPTILAERADDYIVNPKKVSSPFMTMAFESTELARRDLIAALHPADLTARPQILEQQRNPQYYAIIKAFEALTGVGGLLNTSFNLHGHPIVLGPKEAIFTLDNSDND
ncbi:MAG: carbamoyltransferase, partial [Candidatus Omnitrophica bacterium]|nr:carbamoyltransferase [Candidatus Omnitrophota bacterium]